MSEYRTANLHQKYGHPDIVMEVAPDLGMGFEWMLSYFEEAIAGGRIFQENQFVQFGWMMIMLRANEQGDLEIWEPRMDAMPIQWTRGATTTIRHLLVQREVCAQFGVEPVFPTLLESAVISDDFFGSQGFHMEREASQGGSDSGWLFKDFRAGGGRHCSLFEIVVNRPEVMPFLAMPVGSSVRISTSGIDASLDNRNVSSISNGFLAKLVGYRG
ncbi:MULTISPECIES: hypothetical protein [unclassified Cupriavidus]|uniref:immunity protein Imm33 domain-containing protein n=1 Tax=unclassified Cupriavidus TaxID=2640874 RepID=UPI001C001FEB|nr:MULTISPECIES: hypothetical protein [unclassified Cupriavidus]MCA3775197.1 hypothetical protein [Cutibacterium sp.]MCA3186655.1 hypothetical protein [Cupriavidus sp.]MCA3193503.1 hypothetical protein [Cupriavidus sp.]MCA3199588.1 hypothetical protein [Cupriavidus sp.]MCA3203380.1 hypothetical protein [Cupriavidus sp.]